MRSHNRLRRGMSLIEVAAVMAVSATLLTMATGLLYTLMEVEGNSRRRITERVALNRLADQFRRDAHDAAKLEVSDEATWRFSLHDGRTAEYRVDTPGDRIEWTEVSDDQVVRRKTFQLPSGVRVAIDQTSLAKLRLTPTENNCRPVAIEAAIGLDHRFQLP